MGEAVRVVESHEGVVMIGALKQVGTLRLRGLPHLPGP